MFSVLQVVIPILARKVLSCRARERSQTSNGQDPDTGRPPSGKHDWDDRGYKVVTFREAECGPA